MTVVHLQRKFSTVIVLKAILAVLLDATAPKTHWVPVLISPGLGKPLGCIPQSRPRYAEVTTGTGSL